MWLQWSTQASPLYCAQSCCYCCCLPWRPSSYSYIPVEVYKHSMFTSGGDVDPEEVQQWWCGLCCRRYGQWRRLLSLLSGHTNKPACYICGKVISNLQNLYKHIRTIHQRQVSRCDYCGSVFRNAESARKHVLKMHRYDLSHGRGLSMLEPVVSGSWTSSTSTNTTNTTTTTTTTTFVSPLLEQLQQHSIKTEDLT